MMQLQLPGLERCNFQCLANCPLPLGEYCFWDDPDIGMFDLVEYPEFFWWRIDHEDIVQPKPDDPLTLRCPRCYSTKYQLGYPDILCPNCGYSEPLIDFPISYDYHLALKKKYGDNKCPVA